MNNLSKSNWIAIAFCLVYSLLATGGAVFFIKKSAQENQAASLKITEELHATVASMEKANTEAAKAKEALDKEKALNDNLKKIIAEAEMELEKLRVSLKTATTGGAKLKVAKSLPSAAAQNCPPSDSKFSKNKIRALQNLQLDVRKRDRELKEKQKKLDEAMENVAREKRKVTLQNTEYRWPHPAEPEKK